MVLKLYLANFSPEVTEERIQTLFASVGQISRIKITENKNALVWLETEQELSDVLVQFNGQVLDEYRLCLTPSKASSMPEALTDEQRLFAEALAARLGETEPEPCQQVNEIVRLCGAAFAQTVLDDTLDVEARGGMAVRNGTRQRTRGGIFFYLARGRLSIGLQQVIVPYLQKKKTEQTAQPSPGKKKDHPPQITVPALSEEEMLTIRQKLTDLRGDHRAAQSTLDQIQALPAAKQTGMFSAIKRVLDIQRQIDTLIKDHPFLTGT